jgi:NitT/TauT family transport system permease protein
MQRENTVEQERAPALGRSGTSRRGDFGPTVAVVVAVIVAIQIGSFFAPPFVMPSPIVILKATWGLLSHDLSDIGITALRLLASVVFAMSVGVLLGIVMGVAPRIRPYLQSLIIIDTGVPALSWMLVSIFWFRDAEVRIFFILSVILIPFYALSIHDGIRALPRDWLDMIESFRPRRWHVLRYLILPHIVPYILTTSKAVIGYAIRMVIFAELVASAVGIGSRMSLAQSTFRMDEVLGWTLLLVIFNLGLQAAIGAVEKILLKWRAEAALR